MQAPFALRTPLKTATSLILLPFDQALDKIALRMFHGSEMPPMEVGLTLVERLEITLLYGGLAGYTFAAFKAHRRPDQRSGGHGRLVRCCNGVMAPASGRSGHDQRGEPGCQKCLTQFHNGRKLYSDGPLAGGPTDQNLMCCFAPGVHTGTLACECAAAVHRCVSPVVPKLH